jgi:FAD/FMN-containing dehydrogenase
MTQTTGSGAPTLQGLISGLVIGPDSDDYDDARRVWNADIDKRPALIAQCESPQDVSAAVRYAVAENLPVAVRGGAHSMSGACSVEGGLVIDLSKMNGVSVNRDARRARVGGGALLGDLDAATMEVGLATPAGFVSHTGVGGLTLGGGMGWLSRKFGLTIDNLASAQVVTADGEIRTASEDENPDLFWAIRGGSGNFGVVTEFEFRLHEVDPMVSFGLMFWTLDQGEAALRTAAEVIPTLPQDVNCVVGALNAPPEPFVPEDLRLQPGYGMIVVGFGSPEEHAEVIAKIRDRAAPAFEFVTPMPYLALQKMLDEANAWGLYAYDKGCYVEDLSDGVIATMLEHVPKKTSPLSLALFYRLDGGYSNVGDADTAFSGGRSPRYALFIIGGCPVPEMLPAEREWVRAFWSDMQQHAFSVGSYVNGMTDWAEGEVETAYGEDKYARLASIKAKYDPRGVFGSTNANIQPAAV